MHVCGNKSILNILKHCNLWSIVLLLFGLFQTVRVFAQNCGSPPCPTVAPPLCSCGFDDGEFTLNQSIVLDGCFDDWSAVLSDPDNNTCDGPYDIDGPLIDRDAPVQGSGRNLVHFAVTWDNNNFYVYTTRAGSSGSNIDRFIYYADVNNDGLVQTGEPVLLVEWKGSNRRVKGYWGLYSASDPLGDSMVNSLGFADGYTLPGTVTNLSKKADFSGCYGSGNGLSMEFSISWSQLGIPAGSTFTFHISSTNVKPGGGSFPSQVDDNLAGCGGGPWGTQFGKFTFLPDETLVGRRGSILYAAHTITNLGNGDDTFDLNSAISGAHTPSVAYYLDADSSGTFTPGDTLLSDTDGDTIPDTGLMTPFASLDILVCYGIADNGPGDPIGIATIITTATSSFNTSVNRSVTDTVEVIPYPDLVLMKTSQANYDPANLYSNPKRIPGGYVHYTIRLTNTGEGPADNDTIIITDQIPPNTELFVGDLGGNPAGSPVLFVDGPGTDTSGLNLMFSGLGVVGDGIEFSNAPGPPYTYNYDPTPNMDADGFDSNVSSILINPSGVFNGANSGSNPYFEIIFRVRVQ